MLTDLRIKNLALVNDLAIQFGPGYNSITGETGAGKSILIGALGLVLGERADRTLIRDGDDHCSVEAIIEVAALGKAFHSHLHQNGIEPCAENQLFLKRSFSASGGNRQFVNGSPTTLNVLTSIGEWLVDIHGPHDHQSLLKPARQLDILDAYGGLEKQRDDFAVTRRSAGRLGRAESRVDRRRGCVRARAGFAALSSQRDRVRPTQAGRGAGTRAGVSAGNPLGTLGQS